jgi:hypothetical protein
MGCGHSTFDSGCSSCLLQYDQTEAAKWAAEEAYRQRLETQDHHARMERAADHRRMEDRQRTKQSLPGLSNRTMMWAAALGLLIVFGSVLGAFIAAVFQVLKFAVVVGAVGAVGLLILKHRRESPPTT